MVVVADSFAALELLWALCQMSRSAYHHSLTFRCSTVDQHRFVAPNKWAVPEGGQAMPGRGNNPPGGGDEGLVWSGDPILHVTSAVWYKTGMPAVPIRWVLIKDPKGSLNPKRSYART